MSRKKKNKIRLNKAHMHIYKKVNIKVHLRVLFFVQVYENWMKNTRNFVIFKKKNKLNQKQKQKTQNII